MQSEIVAADGAERPPGIREAGAMHAKQAAAALRPAADLEFPSRSTST
jgi:hypothetical protein